MSRIFVLRISDPGRSSPGGDNSATDQLSSVWLSPRASICCRRRDFILAGRVLGAGCALAKKPNKAPTTPGEGHLTSPTWPLLRKYPPDCASLTPTPVSLIEPYDIPTLHRVTTTNARPIAIRSTCPYL